MSRKRKPDLTRMPQEFHGLPKAYNYWGCRCELCRLGWRSYTEAIKEKWRGAGSTYVTARTRFRPF